MGDKELIPLLEQFGIPLPETVDAYNLIGLDYGDGELSAAYVYWDNITEEFTVKGLPLSSNGLLMKNPNAYYISSSSKRMVYDVRESELTNNDGGMRYYNFKKCVCTEEIKAQYILDDGRTAELTYEEVMEEGFNIAVNAILESDVARLIDREKPTIILVGCPSSAAWYKNKIEYAELLRKRLRLPSDITQPVYIAIHKESNAALARELDPKWGLKRIKRHEVIVILDNGSSTVDITVVGTNGIPVNGEDSYQFGGNLIDENLLKLMRKKLNEDYPGMSPKTLHGHKLGLRMKKEAYYGLDGNLLSLSIYSFMLDGKKNEKGKVPKMNYAIDEDVMEEALENMPVSAFHFIESPGSMIKKQRISYHSWLEGCREIYQAFYDEMKQFFVNPGDGAHPVVPHRVILSGGVSVMPEVRALVEDVFGVAPLMADHPNYCVSEGLAYVLISEVRKGQFLREILAALPDILPGADALRDSIIKAGVMEDWDTIRFSLKKWSEDPSALLSIRDWHEDFYIKEFNTNLALPVQKGAASWFKEGDSEKKITDLLEEKFEKIFPEYTDDFHYVLPEINFSSLDGVKVTIGVNHAFLFGKMTANEDANVILSNQSINAKRDKPWREKAYRNILEMGDDIQGGGRHICTYTYMKDRIFFGPVQKEGSTTVEYEGLASMYQSELTDTVVGHIRSEVLSLLEKPLKEYVEMITPYFNMTARK